MLVGQMLVEVSNPRLKHKDTGKFWVKISQPATQEAFYHILRKLPPLAIMDHVIVVT